MASKKSDNTQAPNEEAYVPTTREIAKLVTFYTKNVRAHDKSDMLGIFRQILLMVKNKGITMEDISLAMQNYAADEFTRNNHPAMRHHIRKFMMPEKIRQWKTPVQRKSFSQIQRSQDPSLARLDALEAQAPQPVSTPAKVAERFYDDEPNTDDAL